MISGNSRLVARAAAQCLYEIKPSLPEGVKLNPLYDRTLLVDKTIATVRKNPAEGALLLSPCSCYCWVTGVRRWLLPL